MPSIIFSNGDTSKEVALSEVNSVEDVASHMKEVMTDEQKTTLEELSNSNEYGESEDSEGNSISVDVSKTLESNKELLEHPFYSSHH